MADILVIDDDPVMRTLLIRLLEQAGHRLRASADGAEAVRLCTVQPADLVICDLLMPAQGGLETILAFTTLTPRPKILAISASNTGNGGDFLPLALRLGADRALRKPFTAAALSLAVEGTLAGPFAAPHRPLSTESCISLPPRRPRA